MRQLRRLLLTFAAGIALSGPALADPAIWKVSDADSDIYLFGSVHLFTRDVDWRTPEFDSILNSAEHVYFEVVMDLEAYSAITQFTLTRGMVGGGKTLADLLEPEEFERLTSAAAAVGSDIVVLERMQPWLAAMTLAGGIGPKKMAGVETLVDAEIAPERKRSLETAAEQMGFLADTPLDEQIEGLMSAVEAIERGEIDTLDTLIDAWERGDTVALATLVNDQVKASDKAAYDTLITKRNERWLTPIEQLLADNDESLIIVGAAHLVGSGGVPKLLEQRGYTVERVDEPPPAGPPTGQQHPKTPQRR